MASKVSRPYLNARIDDLEGLFRQYGDDLPTIIALYTELSFRSVPRAVKLRKDVIDRRTQLVRKGEKPVGKPIALGVFKSGVKTSTSVPPSETAKPSSASSQLLPEKIMASQSQKSSMGSLGQSEKSNISAPTDASPTAQSQPWPQSKPSTSAEHAPQKESPVVETKVVQTEAHGKLIDLIDYIEHMVRLTEKPVFTLKSYGSLLFHEAELRGRIGLSLDRGDDDGPDWLRIERLKRTDPPLPPIKISEWIEVSRDPLRTPQIKTIRVVTVPAEEAEALVKAGIALEADVAANLKDKSGQSYDVVLRLEQHPHLRAAIDDYIKGPWARWATEEAPRRETIAIYDAFFGLHQAIQGHGTDKPLEVVWGMGLARWRVNRQDIDMPLIEQLVEVGVSENSAILVRPRATEPQVNLKPFFALDVDGADLALSFAREYLGKDSNADLSPFRAESFSGLLRYAVTILDRQGRYWPDETSDLAVRSIPSIGDSLVVSDTWVIFARPRSGNFFIADLEELKKAVAVTEELPGASKRLVMEPPSEQIYKPSMINLRECTLSADSPVIEPEVLMEKDEREFFFPKAFNEDQEAIIRRLEQSDGVVVQGPPGTGKTHTIANIICHYLATGRRVLITSKTEGALTVLRKHIPEGIRDLSISLLTNEREGLKQLERAVSLLATTATQLDPRKLERDIDSGQTHILDLKGRIARIDNELLSFAAKHLGKIKFGSDGRETLPMEVAQAIVGADAEHAWLPDSLGHEDQFDPQFDELDILAARDARRALGADIVYLGMSLPKAEALPDLGRITSLHQDLTASGSLEQKVRSGELPGIVTSATNIFARAEVLLRRLEETAKLLEEIEAEEWLLTLYRLWQRHGIDGEPARLFNSLLPAISELVTARVDVISHAVEIPDGSYHRDDLLEAVDRAASGISPFGIFSFGKGEVKGIFTAIRVEGRFPNTSEDWRKVQAYLRWRRSIAVLVVRWRPVAVEHELPVLTDEGETTAKWLALLSGRLQKVHDLLARHAPEIRSELAALIPNGIDTEVALSQARMAREACEILQLNIARLSLSSARKIAAELSQTFNGLRGPIGNEARTFFIHTLGNPVHGIQTVVDHWQRLVAEIERLRSLSHHFTTLHQVAEQVQRSGGIAWAKALETEPAGTEDDVWTPSFWRKSWDWKRQSNYLRKIDGRERIKDLSAQRLMLDGDLKKAFAEVVRLRTYLGLRISITERVQAALQMFLAALKMIGKGTGKRTAQGRSDARGAMKRSYAAVPCWIMPTWRVSETLPAELGSFDLVIVDEASQSDIAALPALVRGKKVLIVGDDKQVSPTASFIEVRKLLQLRHNYLQGQPFAAIMLPGSSLYDLALAAFPGTRVMLREHFRCVEPIIRFSFQFYAEEIVPVRVPKPSERLDPPLIDVYLPHGRRDKRQINTAEANAIVDEIARLVEDPRFVNRSIGVISLIANKQAHFIQQLLLERIGEEAFLRHDIACGDSATFQGKERDIIFLSMVECSASKSTKTMAMFQQRFNVALSRARDRMYLFRSVTEEMLSPEDLKAKVIRHFNEPMGGRQAWNGDLISLCDSGFEREVFTWLRQRGYRVMPQVKVGPFSIDLVVEGADDRRLAIELDGDKYHTPERWADDFARQRVLERVGWRFWRCWGSSFILDRESCLADLEQTLKSLGIHPLAGEAVPSIYTEHRVISLETIKQGTSTSLGALVSDPATVVAESEEDRAVSEDGIRVGDRVVISYADEPSRQRSITISANENDPDLGILNHAHPLSVALLGAKTDEEVEVPAGGGTRVVIVLKIERSEADVVEEEIVTA